MSLATLQGLFRGRRSLGVPEPDFLCVGMEKAATAWLYDQLRAHPDFWMPPVKELRYLHMAAPSLDDLETTVARLGTNRRTAAADRLFLNEIRSLAGQPRDLEKYAALFRFKGPNLSGDITPAYRRLKGEDISALAARFPRLKVLLIVRDPVERAWSHICMQYRRKLFDGALLDNIDAFARWFARSTAKRASFGSPVPLRWAGAAPAIPFRHFFFDDVVSAPKATRDEIVGFLGGDSRKKSGRLPPDYNRKAGQSKLPLADGIQAVLVENLAGELRDSARLFGGPAKAWPARYGL